ncbi:MAG: peptidyl-prolyl cis-trans isomerase [Bacteroidales bacterium]|nr:peptidyl-prolyl cis-trans isomerase [Bacteroidales bacterium]
MAVLQKLRGWGIILSILVALPLLLFIIDPSQVLQAVESLSSKYDIGVISGKSINYADFQSDVDRFGKLHEMMSGTSASSEEAQKQVRDAAWQSLIDKYLFLKNAQAAGINVGLAEMSELTRGGESPIISANPAFAGEDGSFSPEALSEFVSGLDNDNSGNMRLYWDYVQNAVYTSQYYNKYNAIFSAADVENALMRERAIAENNTTAEVDFVMAPFSYVKDTTIVIADAAIKKYYAAHKETFKQQASRDIEYVVYQVVPSTADIDKQNDEFVALYDEFTAADNLKAFLQRNSDRQLSQTWYKAGDLRSVAREVDTFVADNGAGSVSPVIRSGNNFFAVKVTDAKNRPESVDVRYIVISGDNAQHRADSLVGALRKGAEFSTVAVLNGAPGTVEPGVQGTTFRHNNVPEGLESVMDAKKGVPYVVTVPGGAYIMEVTGFGENALMKQVAILEKEIVPSQETFNAYYNLANRLATLAGGSYKNFTAAVDSLSRESNSVAATYAHPMTIYESTSSYSGVDHAKEVTRWAFDNKPGKASGIITVGNNNFFVAAVKAAHKEGIAPIEEVSESIKNRLYSEEYAKKQVAEISEKIAGKDNLEAIAEVLGTTVSSQSDVSFASIGSRQNDPKFLGAVAAAKEGEICGPVSGSFGTYVFMVKSREVGSHYTEDDAQQERDQLGAYKAQMLVSVMMDDADVKDNRARFY